VKNRLWTLLLCAVLICLLPGCWDGVELQKRAVVLMVGIDPSDQDDHGVKVSLQLARPQSFSRSPQGSTSSREDNTAVITKSGTEVTDALRKIQLSIDRNLFFGHVRAVVINQVIAQRGILPVVSPVLQSRITPRESWLFVSASPAREVLEYTPSLDAIPSTYFTNYFENRLLLNRPYEVTLGGFHQRLVTPGIQPFAIWIGRGNDGLSAPRIEGIAAFSADRFVGGLNPQQALGWLFIENQFPKSPLSFQCPTKKDGQFVINVKSVKSTLHMTRLKSNEPQAIVRLSLKGWVEGGACVIETNQMELEQLRQQVKNEVKNVVETSIQQCQAMNTDIFGMGRNVYRYSPRDWHGDNEWDQTFRKVKTAVQVDVQLDFLQTYKKSALPLVRQ
jgi:spore germination protein KC